MHKQYVYEERNPNTNAYCQRELLSDININHCSIVI